MRIFTNEDATVNALARADETSDALSWNDPYLLGQLFPTRDLELYSAGRARELASFSWDEEAVLFEDFSSLSACLEESIEKGKVSLLFGGSLRDHLKLAFVASVAAERFEDAADRLRLTQIDGSLDIFEDGALLEVAKASEPMDSGSIETYRSVWNAIASNDAGEVERIRQRLFVDDGHSTLSLVLKRWLQELPSVENGLSLTEFQTLDAVRVGVDSPQPLFECIQETETAPFRLNWEFWNVLQILASGDDPLLWVGDGDDFICPPRDLAWESFYGQRLVIADAALECLENRSDAMKSLRPGRWLGGVRVDAGCPWRWDYRNDCLVRLEISAEA